VTIGTDQQVIKSGWPVSFEHAIGEKQYYTVKFPIREFGGKISSIGGLSIDITDRKKLEGDVKQSELRLRTILNTEPECVSILNEKGEFLEINKAGLNMIEAEDLESLKGINMSQLIQERFRNDFIELIEEVFQGGEGMFEFKITSLKGKERWVEIHAVPMRNASGGIASFLGVTRDVTQRKEADRKLQESEQRYRKLFELNPVPTWIYDTNTLKFLDVNNAAIRHYGYSAEEFKKMTIEEIRPGTEKQRLRESIERQRKRIHGESASSTRLWKHLKKDGTEVDVEVQATSLDVNDPLSRLVTINDVTEKLKTQNKLLDLVKEKEMLIREIHHRVKNNLQLISSILYIQIARMTAGEMKDFLNEMRQRIKSIAFLHERLLQSGSINQLDMSQYLPKLIADISQSSDKVGPLIKIKSEIDQVWVDTDVAIYCGLIMNELITNSIKYAFVGRAEGKINVSLKRIDSKFEFSVADDGIGMPVEMATNVNSKSSFGMQLLDTFGKQINATVSIDNVNGTKFKYTFS
jgi:PAS domain S-box-containing protein